MITKEEVDLAASKAVVGGLRIGAPELHRLAHELVTERDEALQRLSEMEKALAAYREVAMLLHAKQITVKKDGEIKEFDWVDSEVQKLLSQEGAQEKQGGSK